MSIVLKLAVSNNDYCAAKALKSFAIATTMAKQ